MKFVRICVTLAAMPPSITLRRPLASGVWAAALLTTPLAAYGQVAGLDARADVQRNRSDAAISTGRGSLVSRYAFGDSAGQGENLGFTFNALLPAFYNSNAETFPSGGTQTAETNPEARLAWSRQLQVLPIKLSALADANVDRYARSNGADGDVAFGKFRAQYMTGNDDQEFEPFIGYGPKTLFSPTFASALATQHDFTIGFDKAYNFDYAFNKIGGDNSPIARSGDTSSATVWSFGFTGTITRRLTDAGVASTILAAAPSITYNLTNLPNSNSADAQWNISFETDVSRRWYDRTNGFARRDSLVNPILTIEFLPPLSWFGGENKLEQDHSKTALGRPVIDLQFSFARNYSNQTGSAFRQWAVGPILKTAWKF